MKKELGKWILDVAKYLTTAGLIAPFLTKVEDWTWWMFSGIIGSVALMVTIGLMLTRETEKKNKKTTKK